MGEQRRTNGRAKRTNGKTFKTWRTNGKTAGDGKNTREGRQNDESVKGERKLWHTNLGIGLCDANLKTF